ncbi:MAG: type IV toxin-antitoxin system AbiEi family antitoxin domain-containing protein [Candidatus Aureabacteria bacterium]|nr:type IV toxin-antitoxin system AbiEi family antitoxin domain-containing protein [Candidatus Auribacterota bacterium]
MYYEKTKKQKLFEIASLQQGYFTAKQAITAGFSYRMHYHYRQTGEWLEIDRGIFRLAQFPNSPDEDYVRWSLWSRDRKGQPQAVISHESALSIHELSDIMPSKIYFTVPPGFRKKAPKNCVIHRGKISNDEKEQREGFFVTDPLRTIIDSADSNFSIDYLKQAVQEACNKGMIQIIDIVSAEMSEKAKEKIMAVLKIIKKENCKNSVK